jgi:ribosome-associated protein
MEQSVWYHHYGGINMQVLKIRQEDEFIKLGQAIKAAGLVGSGVEAKIVIQNGDVYVNGSVETQRGKKLVGGETVSYNGEEVRIER